MFILCTTYTHRPHGYEIKTPYGMAQLAHTKNAASTPLERSHCCSRCTVTHAPKHICTHSAVYTLLFCVHECTNIFFTWCLFVVPQHVQNDGGERGILTKLLIQSKKYASIDEKGLKSKDVSYILANKSNVKNEIVQ